VTSHGLLVVSKESWGDTRWARKQWLPFYLAQLSDFKKILYLDRHSVWWRGESAHAPVYHQKTEVIQENLILPFERNRQVRQWNRKRIANRLVNMLDDQLVWSTIYYHPFDLPMMQTLKKRSKVIFDWTEDWAVFHDDSEISALQIESVKNADAVITVTRQLRERAVAIRGNDTNVFHVPNASVFERSDAVAEEPEEIRKLEHPRIGFVGHAGPWFDEQLVADIARKRPGWQWVMVGGCGDRAKQQLEGLTNVHWQGVHSPEGLMAFMQHCDVLAAPYKRGIEGDATKLYDYLVAAKPILSIPCETAELLQPWVTVCRDSAEWISTLEDLLSIAGDTHFVSCSEEITASHHWQARASRVADIIGDLQHG